MRIYPNLDTAFIGQIIRAVAEDETTVRRMVADIRPATEPVGEYVTELEERRKVFAELRELCRKHHTTPYAAVLGFFMVAPLDRVRDLLAQCRAAPRASFWLNSVKLADASCVPTYLPVAPGFMPAPPRVPDNDESDDQSWHDDDDAPTSETIYQPSLAAQKALTRDRATCPFTTTPSPAVVLLAPPSQPSPSLSILHTLWGESTATAWSRAADDARDADSPQNHLCLNRQLRHWFEQARFALKPLRCGPSAEDGEKGKGGYELVVQWHWLRRSKLAPRMGVEMEVGEDKVMEMAGLLPVEGEEGTRGWGWECDGVLRGSGVPIRTGQTFVIWAEREEDLPSRELMEMRWVLQRVAAICGAAEEGAREEVY
ncbi:hypothetical protein C8A05DRAFT_12130 [Staphylotrichum tortipilum]|uniref:HNH nuclease domain-containing protein n=1 Tax=Staphylotrichum tortipilum TaxID=2831512 RepID=A0AAN6RX71_9PEZI|nr:hypothetical protein C8A05DRAFT_12130 [Staphylotrichum longicolle]